MKFEITHLKNGKRYQMIESSDGKSEVVEFDSIGALLDYELQGSGNKAYMVVRKELEKELVLFAIDVVNN